MKEFPDDLLIYFYRNWLALVDFVRLDSALTEKKSRLRQRELITMAIQSSNVANTISKLCQCDQGYIQAAMLDNVPLLSIMTFLDGLNYNGNSSIRISFTPLFFQEFEVKYQGRSFPLVEGAMIDGVNWNNQVLRMFRLFELFPNLTSLSIHCISNTTMFYQSFFRGIQESKVTDFTVLSKDLYPSYSLSFLQYILRFTGNRLENVNYNKNLFDLDKQYQILQTISNCCTNLRSIAPFPSLAKKTQTPSNHVVALAHEYAIDQLACFKTIEKLSIDFLSNPAPICINSTLVYPNDQGLIFLASLMPNLQHVVLSSSVPGVSLFSAKELLLQCKNISYLMFPHLHYTKSKAIVTFVSAASQDAANAVEILKLIPIIRYIDFHRSEEEFVENVCDALVLLHSHTLEGMSFRDDSYKHHRSILLLLDRCRRIHTFRLSDQTVISKELEEELVKAVVQKAAGLTSLHLGSVGLSVEAVCFLVSKLSRLCTLHYLDALSPSAAIKVVRLLASLPRSSFKKLVFAASKDSSSLLQEVRSAVVAGLKVLQLQIGKQTWGNGRIELRAERLV